MKVLFWLITSSLVATVAQAQVDYSDFFSGNGSFELNQKTNIVFSYPAPHLGVPTFNDHSVLGWRMHRSTTGGGVLSNRYDAADGDRYLRLRSWRGSGQSRTSAGILAPKDTPSGTLHHTPFTVGALYEMSFWAAGEKRGSNGLNVSISFPSHPGNFFHFDLPNSMVESDDGTQTLDWRQYSFHFVAADETMGMSLWSAPNTEVPGLESIANIDNFQLRQIPEPGSAFLVITSALSFLFCRRRIQL